MVIRNAITRAFDNPTIGEHYGYDKSRRMCNAMLSRVPLNKETDTPIPEWLITLLCDNTVGYRERIRIAFMHHKDITNKEINHYLVRNKTGRMSKYAKKEKYEETEES